MCLYSCFYKYELLTRGKKSFPTCLLDVQFARPNAVDELGGFRGSVVCLDQQVLVEVTDSAASLQLGVRRRVCGVSLGPPLGLHVHQLLQGTAIRAISDW